MNAIYKIETYCESSVNQLANLISESGGSCIVLGWAIITDHIFNEEQTKKALSLVGHISDTLTEDDMYSWSSYHKCAA